jgi:hypothetical protein
MDMGYSAANELHNSKHIHILGVVNTQNERISRDEGKSVGELNAGAVISRMRQAADVRSDTALGSYFGLGTSAVSNWRARNTVPFAECVILSTRKGVSLDWLIFGIDDGRADDRHRVRDRPPTDERMARMCAFISHWEATRSDDDKVWLEMQLARAVPEYAEWVAARSKGNY